MNYRVFQQFGGRFGGGGGGVVDRVLLLYDAARQRRDAVDARRRRRQLVLRRLPQGASPVEPRFYWVSLRFTDSSLNFIQTHNFVMCFTGFSCLLPGFTGLYQVLPVSSSFKGFYRVLLGFTE